MAELLIRFRRPRALSDSETTAKLATRAQPDGAELDRQAPDVEGMLLRVPMRPTRAAETEERLARLLLDGTNT
jgi:hypothetical protein